MLEFLIFCLIAGGIIAFIQYNKLSDSTIMYTPPTLKPDYPIHQEDHEYLDESDG